MIIKKLETFYIVSNFKEHKKLKKDFLNLINKIPLNSYKADREDILHTDWNLPKEYKREYADLFLKNISPYMIKIAKKLYSKTCKVNNIWFQQYKKNNLHNWHNHQQSNYTNIYYLELPNKNMKTQLYDLYNKKILTFNVNEGDLLTFPANMLHRSKKNNSNNRKSIISFNCDFYDVILK